MNPLITIWYKPSETFDLLLKENQKSTKFIWIFYLVSLTRIIPFFFEPSKIEEHGLLVLIIETIIITIIVGLGLQYLWVYIFEVFGKLLRGKANRKEIRIVFAYSLLPFLFNLLIEIMNIPSLMLDKSENTGLGTDNNLTVLILFILFVRFFIIGISKAQKFSYSYAIISFLIPTFIIGLLTILIL